MECPHCGTNLADTAEFCTNCGKSVKPAAQNDNQFNPNDAKFGGNGAAYQAPPYGFAPIPPRPMTENDLPEQYRPMGAWAYFGLQILFSIPVIGFIFLIIFSCSSGNINRRNFARSYWCSLIIVGVILLVYLVLALVLGAPTLVDIYDEFMYM